MIRRRTVLCVDDNHAFSDNLREVLEDRGYAAHTAASCTEAEALAARGFDVAVVDLRLPDGEGTALGGRLRALAADAQVILLTGFASLESAAAAVRAGAWAYLVKPCAMPDLLLSIEQAMGQVELLEARRELERRAQMAEKLAAIGTLTAGLSHEIKNPLNAAALQLKVVDNRLRRLSAEAQALLSPPLLLVQDEIIRLNQVLEEFLQFARPRELVLVPFDLAALLGRVVDLLAVEAERAQIQLERRWSGELSTLGDEPRLQQVILNLVRNAIQATPPGGFVRVDAELGARMARFSVEDSGPGIPEELRRRIFEPFFTTKSGGSGLGLPLVHSIVEQHRGSVAIERGELGGARFVVWLPVALGSGRAFELEARERGEQRG